ncbi:DEKNAAC103370 [Brettanomyces naardenensis]|uniref:DEKNAAC103370 n=1 Tax=Brettanomyces naardenensis TaxID=13370 RepID=A0A448YNL7_BRENA|nr:DEKNAAC103370 [Brettanomyces naardenensis]
MDPAEYLQPEFDASKLTMPKLRSILLDQDIEYPSSANKSELVDLFNTHIKSNSEELLKKYTDANVPSTDGIIFVDTPKQKKTKSKPASADESVGEKETPSKVIPTEVSTPEAAFSSNNVFQKKSPASPRGARSAQKTPARRSPVTLKSPESDSVPVFSQSVPKKRSSPPPTSPKKKRALKRASRKADDSMHSDSSLSPSVTPVAKKSTLGIEKFEDFELDDLMKQYIKTPSGIESPAFKTPSKNSDILDHYSKSASGGKIAKKTSSNRLKKNLKRVVKEQEVRQVPEEIVSEVSESSPKEAESKAILQEETVSTFEEEQASISHLEDSSIIDVAVDQDIEVEVISGPSHQIINETFHDDEKTIKGERSDDEVAYKAEESTYVSFDISNADDTTDVDESSIKQEEQEVVKESILDEIKDKQEVKPSVAAEKPQSKHFLFSFFIFLVKTLLFLSLVSAVFVFSCYRTMKLNAGYCGLPNSNDKPLSLWPTVPQKWEVALEPLHPYVDKAEAYLTEQLAPQCATCPEHGTCYENSELVCDNHYTVSHPLRSLLGLIPNEEECVYDEYAEKKMQLLTEYTLKLLRKRDGEQLSLDELHTYLKATKPSYMSNKEFEEYWNQFINYDISKEPEIKIDLKTRSISIQHKTPTQFLTRTFGESIKSRKLHLYDKSLPTSTFDGYSDYQEASYKKVAV